MSYTDQQLLADLQRVMIEPVVDNGLSWLSGLWTLDEVLGYANQRQQRFLANTCLVGGWLQTACAAQEIQTLDQETVFINHVLYEDANPGPGLCTPLLPLSRFSADLVMPGWPAQTLLAPRGYLLSQTGTNELSLVPPPTTAGLLHLFGIFLADTLDRSGVQLVIPDEWVPYLRYGIMADMFGKEGEAYDEPRHDYCESRWQEGIEAARAVLEALI